ncbi:MAG: substrate-binding domain-containing protein [Actinomycetota bacterium]|nr:substrate-binding domain-containing protein [Actinomycetota bacterium]
MTRNRRFGAAATVLLTIALAGCSSSVTTAPSAAAPATAAAPAATVAPAASAATVAPAATGKSIKDCSITMIPKTTDNPYFTAIEFGANKAAAELGGKNVDFVGSPQADVPGQIQRIQAATVTKVCAILVSALDPNAVAPAMEAAIKQGIAVVGYDADTLPAARQVFVLQFDPTVLGVDMAQDLAKQMNYKGDFAILSAQSTAANQNAWIAAALNELKKPQYSGMHLVKTVYGNDDYQTSYNLAVSLMQAYPNLAGIFTPEPAGLESAVKARSDLKFNPKLVVAGLGWPPSDDKLLLTGQVPSFWESSPNDLGYLVYYTTAALVTGQITGKPGETFTAGKLGPRTIGANSMVTLGDPVMYTKDNVEGLLSGYQTK